MKAKVDFYPVTNGVIDELFANMRQDDFAEVSGNSYYSDPRLEFHSKISRCEWATAAYIDGELAGLFGVAPRCSVLGKHCVWLLTTEKIDEYPVTFFRESARIVEWMRREYHSLENWVDLRYTRAIRWLDRLGATFHEVQTAPSGVQYQRIEL